MFSPSRSRLLACATVLAAVVFAAPALAAPESYFASFGGGTDNIGKYPATPNAWGTEFATGNDPHSLTVSGDNLYWVQGNDIYRQNVNSGSKSLFQSFGIAPIDLAVDVANGSYYASFGGGSNNIGKYPLVPDAWGTEFAATGSGAHGLSLAGSNMYWIDGNDIWMQGINSVSKTLFQSFGIAPLDLVVDAINGFYYASFGGGTDNIGKYPLVPDAWGTEFSSGNDTHSLNIVDDKLYWIEGNNIWRADLDGTDKELFQEFGIAPLDLALYSAPVVEPEPPVPGVPEPTSIILLGLGIAALSVTRRKSEEAQRPRLN